MGEGIIRFYHEKVKKSWKTAFISAFLVGLMVHMFRFVNVLPNHDALYNYFSTQNMVASGRWFLAVACAPSSYFDLPWMIGILSLLYMSLTAVVITEIFEMKNPVLIVLCSSILVSFPGITETMFFEFTADGYMLAMFFAAISVLLTKINRNENSAKSKFALKFFSGLCICLACGIYQVYISFAYVLAVCYFMMELMENRYSKREYVRWIMTQVTVYILALVGYYLIWKLALKMQNVEPTSYLGIEHGISFDLSQFPVNILTGITSFAKFFVEWNILELGLTPYTVLNILFIGFSLLGGVKVMAVSGCLKRKDHLALLILCVISIPVIGCIFSYTSQLGYSARMLQSVCILFIFVAVIYERWLKVCAKNLILALLIATVFNNCVTANMYYQFMHQCYEKSYAMAVELSTRIHLHDTGNEKQIAIVGWLPSFDDEDKIDEEALRYLGSLKDVNRLLTTSHRNIALFLYNNLDFELSYYKTNDELIPMMDLGETPPVPDGWSIYFPLVDEEEKAYFESLHEVREMPCWPAAGAIKTIGDTIVIKLSEVD